MIKNFMFSASIFVIAMSGTVQAQAGEFFAYIDPFTGSVVIQVLAMAFLSILIFFKNLKASVLGFFGYGKTTNSESEEAEESAEDKLETIKLESNVQNDSNQGRNKAA
ncbi:MAG: hypothetical protein LBE18_05610 [Planctomycetaceae bacterium]|jgi:hypothetical protein|nr:hypothetical protein [Planctomycetaceae bacterium]